MQLDPLEVVLRFPDIDPTIVVNPRVEKRSAQLWINPLPNQSKVYVRTMVGFGLDAVYLVCRATSGVDKWPEDWLSWRQNQHVFLVTCDPSEASIQLIRQYMPTWIDLSLAQAMLQRNVEFDDLPTGRAGRYTVDDAVTANQRNALSLAWTHMFPLNEIEFVPDVSVLYNNKQSRFTGRPVSLWSDGAIVLNRECWRSDGEITLTRDVENLLAIALRQESWRKSERWRLLLAVRSIQQETLSSERDSGSGWTVSWSAEKTLQRILTDTGLVLFLVVDAGGALGPDGDTWEYAWLFEEETEARSKYNEINISR